MMATNEGKGGKPACERIVRPPQELIPLLASGENYAKIAERLGVSRNTVRAWVTQPEVIADLAEIRADTMDSAKRKISASIDAAVSTLLDVMAVGDSSTSRVAAARVLLDRCLPAMTATEVTGTVGVTDLRQLTDDALIAERDALAAKLSPTTTTVASHTHTAGAITVTDAGHTHT